MDISKYKLDKINEMRHNKKNNHLDVRLHRDAMLSNMATSYHAQAYFTTVPKAKELRKFANPLLKSKEDTTSSRRHVFSILQNKFAVTELFRIGRRLLTVPVAIPASSKPDMSETMRQCALSNWSTTTKYARRWGCQESKTRRSRRKDQAAAAATEPKAAKSGPRKPTR